MVSKINKIPERSPKDPERAKEIDLCLKLEINAGYQISTDNPSAWKSAFYNQKRKTKNKNKFKVVTQSTDQENHYYINILRVS